MAKKLEEKKSENLFKTTAFTKRDHTPQQLLVTKQINVTGMQNKRQTRGPKWP